MSVCSANSFNVSQQQQSNPVKENNRPAKCESDPTVEKAACIALLVFAAVCCLAAGVTLITLGALTVNPLFLELGITLLFLPAIIGLKICIDQCR